MPLSERLCGAVAFAAAHPDRCSHRSSWAQRWQSVRKSLHRLNVVSHDDDGKTKRCVHTQPETAGENAPITARSPVRNCAASAPGRGAVACFSASSNSANPIV
jgi:hypothetical protein